VTRLRIAEAARQLFAADGYGATTLAGIAREAGVAVQTVYAVYGSKAGILRALREGLVNQREADALFEAAVKERARERKLELFARSIRQRWEKGHDIVAANEEAARTDPGVKREVERILRVRRDGIARLARSISGTDSARAAAILDVLTLPEVYRELVHVHGWTADDFETWLARTPL
jgi:TetR/AcrR family transcriptional regulator, regulator of autoinduction and epiphytic fitness